MPAFPNLSSTPGVYDIATSTRFEQAHGVNLHCYSLVQYQHKEVQPASLRRGCLFQQAGAPWAGESFGLKSALIHGNGEVGGGGRVFCPVEFDVEDIHETMILKKAMIKPEKCFDIMQTMGCAA